MNHTLHASGPDHVGAHATHGNAAYGSAPYGGVAHGGVVPGSIPHGNGYPGQSDRIGPTADPDRQPAAARSGGATERCERILVVEDDSDLCSLLCDLLSTQGYKAEASSDGLEAVRRVATECPDAVVLDVMIPGLDGFAVCEKLKFSRQTNQIPILMLTALDGRESRQRGLRVGADRYLTKPFEPDKLLNEIRDTIEHRRKMEQGNVRTAVELQMQSDSQLREQLNDLLSELFRFTPLPEEELGRIRYAALEMVQNAIEWGNRKDVSRTVRISYEVTDDAVKFVITDEGEGFNPTHLPHAASDDDPISHMEVRQKMGLREGGFGIMIAKGMVDEVRYNDAGNQVTLIKYLKPRGTNGTPHA